MLICLFHNQESIAGKSNVVCISKDSRNYQPTEEELKMADYVFYRTFDVGLCTILDKMDDKVGGLESTCICILNYPLSSFSFILIGL